MASVAFTAFLPEVIPHVAGCPEPTAVNAIRNATIELCERAPFWQETQDVETVTDGDFPLDVTAPSGARVAHILSVTVNGTPIYPVAIGDLEGIAQWRDAVGTQPSAYFQNSPNQLALYPRLSTAATLVVRVAYAPKRGSSSVEEYVYQAYLEAIAAGALWRLMEMPGNAWSNPTLGSFYRTHFQQAVVDASIAANKTFSSATLRVDANPLI